MQLSATRLPKLQIHGRIATHRPSKCTLLRSVRSPGAAAGRYSDRPQGPADSQTEQTMGRIIIISFSTLDGVIEDPDGSQGRSFGGWALRHGPEVIAGDKFRLGSALDTGVLLLGRHTWELFSRIWPDRTTEFAAAMNRIPKLVASATLTDAGAWVNSSVVKGDLIAVAEGERLRRDVIVAGSASVVHALAERDLVDEYRILLFPAVVGRGARLFPLGRPPSPLRLLSAEPVGPTVLLRYERSAA